MASITGTNENNIIDTTTVPASTDAADQISGGNGNDQIWGGGGNDQIHGDNGNDQLWGDTGDDTVNGGNGDDQITGGWEDDLLSGDNGNDQITGGLGDDLLSGGKGDDTFFYNYVSGNFGPTAIGLEGFDRITDFNPFADHLVLNDFRILTGTNGVILTTVGNNTVITFDNLTEIDRTITLEGVTGFASTQAAVDAGWLVFT